MLCGQPPHLPKPTSRATSSTTMLHTNGFPIVWTHGMVPSRLLRKFCRRRAFIYCTLRKFWRISWTRFWPRSRRHTTWLPQGPCHQQFVTMFLKLQIHVDGGAVRTTFRTALSAVTSCLDCDPLKYTSRLDSAFYTSSFASRMTWSLLPVWLLRLSFHCTIIPEYSVWSLIFCFVYNNIRNYV